MMEMQLLDVRELESLKALENGPEDSFFDELVDLFIEQTPEVVEILKNGVQAGETNVVERAAHRLKGMGRNLGAVAFAHICAKIEFEVGQKGLDGLDVIEVENLVTTHRATCEALKDQKRAMH